MGDEKNGQKAWLLRIAANGEFRLEASQTGIIDDAEIKGFVQRLACNVLTD
jgi:hypothetical protein